MDLQEVLSIRRKVAVIEYAKATRNAVGACRDFDVPRASFYRWKKLYGVGGARGIERRRSVARSHPRPLSAVAVEKLLDFRPNSHLRPRLPDSVRRGLPRLPPGTPRRAIHSRRGGSRSPHAGGRGR